MCVQTLSLSLYILFIVLRCYWKYIRDNLCNNLALDMIRLKERGEWGVVVGGGETGDETGPSTDQCRKQSAGSSWLLGYILSQNSVPHSGFD